MVIPHLLDTMTNDAGVTAEILKGYPITLEDVNVLSYNDRLTPRALDKYLLCRFYPYSDGMSTTSMHPQQFASYVMQVIIWAEDVFECRIPDPNSLQPKLKKTLNEASSS